VLRQEHPDWRNRMVEVPKNGKAAERMIEDWHRRHPKEDVTFEQVTGKLSSVLGGGNLDLAKEFLRFVERHKNEGNIAKSDAPAYREGTAHYLESSGYEQAIGAARVQASARPEEERQRILDVADRAQRRLDSYRAGLLTAAKAKRQLAKLPLPSESFWA
jgi:hypothetical protein